MAIERGKHEQFVNELKHKLALTSQEVGDLRKELASRPLGSEVQGLKRQLRVLQKVSPC